MTCNFITCFTTFCKFIWHKKTLWINCFCNHQTIHTLSTRLMSKSLSYFKAVTFRVKNIVSFCVKKLLHFALKSCYILRQKLLHFGLMLHFASKLVTFRVNVTFCVNCYILRRNRLSISSRLRQTANNNLYHLTKFPLYLSFTVHYFYT